MTILVGCLEYEIDDSGMLFKRRGKGMIKAWPDKDGYLKYSLQQKGKTLNVIVHRLIWTIFKGEIPEGYTVDHIDGDKLNNHISNLQLLSPEENAIKGNARNWIVTNPSGDRFEVYNMSAFCREHNLNRSHMYEVASGYKNQTQHKGWKCYER